MSIGRTYLHTSAKILHQDEARQKQHHLSSSATDTSQEQSVIAEKQERANVVAQLRKSLSQKRTELEPVVKKRLEDLGKRWNEYSGYEEVLDAKAQTLEAELHLKQLRDQQSTVRENYMGAIQARSSSQKTLNDLLSRRSNWSEADISTYTQLLRSEHSEARSEREAGEQYETIERKVNTAWDDVVKKTLERYHLEQVWSDRVRAGSTYGGLIVAGLNVFLFTVAFLLVEPYKRKKLAQTFEARLLLGEEQNTAILASVVKDFEKQVGSMHEQGEEVNGAIQLLLTKAGIHVQGGEEDGKAEDDETVVVVVPAPASFRSVEDKRKELALAGGLGFAIGAGILAAMGALRS
ncbi:hypothetical protein CBS101457_002211 [Exobasidium rhododendri]|nr:hypothetical protein CBS101457_002211 [Exobasidium rhododendri]